MLETASNSNLLPGFVFHRTFILCVVHNLISKKFFIGQGVQRVGMATPWLEAFPSTAGPILEEMDSTLNVPLSRIIAEGPNGTLTATETAQPAIMATSI